MAGNTGYQVLEMSRGRERTANRDGQLVWTSSGDQPRLMIALVFDAPDAADRTTPRQIRQIAQEWLDRQNWITDRQGSLRHARRTLAQLVAQINNELKQGKESHGQHYNDTEIFDRHIDALHWLREPLTTTG